MKEKDEDGRRNWKRKMENGLWKRKKMRQIKWLLHHQGVSEQEMRRILKHITKKVVGVTGRNSGRDSIYVGTRGEEFEAGARPEPESQSIPVKWCTPTAS
jgi:hypothetical protein